MRKSIAALTAGVMLMLGSGAALVVRAHPDRHARAQAVAGPDDGMIYDNVQPWTDPEPPFPLACQRPGSCELGPDSVCTIIYVAIGSGESEQDIVQMLALQHDEIHATDFAACDGFAHYWSGTDSA